MAQNTFARYLVRHGNMARAIGIAVGTLILLVVATIPLFGSASEMTGKITAKRKESRELTDKVSILSGLDVEVLNERVRILDQALPPRKDVVLYLSAIDGLSRELNLNFGGISLSPGEVTEATGSATKASASKKFTGLDTLETDIDITGTQENIYAFLRLVEESVPLMTITDVKVSGVSADNYMLSLKLSMLYAISDVKAVKGPITLFDEKEEGYFQQLAKYRKFESLSGTRGQGLNLGKTNLFESFTPQP